MDDRWYSSALARGAQTIPTEVRDGVVGGAVTFAWTTADDQPALVVGVPLPAADAEFYEVVSTTELRVDARHAGHRARRLRDPRRPWPAPRSAGSPRGG